MQAAINPRRQADTPQLEHCRSDFMKGIATQGYSQFSIRRYELTIERFCDEVASSGVTLKALNAASVTELQENILGMMTDNAQRNTKYQLEKFVHYLVDIGIIERPEKSAKTETPREQLRQEYETYLRVQRGMSSSTITHCLRYYERFFSFHFGKGLGNLNKITSDDIVAFLLRLTSGSQPYRSKTLPSHLRNLFKFLLWSGKTNKNLAESIPRIAQPQPANTPRYLPPEDVQRLINAARSDDDIGRRNYAMLLLMARLGLRSTEVVAIRLDDINWRAGEILVRGKGKLHDRMPLPADVGESLADYVKNGRKGTSRVLFVSHRAPHQAFIDSQILNVI
ncbi:MAG: site-specific integrase [Planctomycetes bacterium]|nr:site-specific integrase [Planctomycetota bacterium]